MQNIIKSGILPLKSNECLGKKDGKNSYRAVIGYSSSFFDKNLNQWVATHFTEDKGVVRVRNSRICLEVSEKHVKIFDVDGVEVCNEEVILLETPSKTDKYTNLKVLCSDLAKNISVTCNEIPNGWQVIRTLENNDAWMEIKYILCEGRALEREVNYKWKRKLDTSLRFSLQWERIQADSLSKQFGLTKEAFDKLGYYYYSIYATEFALFKDDKPVLCETVMELHQKGLLANTSLGLHKDGNGVWMHLWTKPQPATAEGTIKFDSTYTNTNPSYDGFVYKEFFVIKSVAYDVWYNDNIMWSLNFGQRFEALDGSYYSRAYIMWDITLIPNNAIISNVKINVWGYLSPNVQSQVKILAYNPALRTAEQIYGDVGSGTVVLTSNTFPIVGSQSTWDLGSTAVTSVQTHLSSDDRWYIGCKNTPETAHWELGGDIVDRKIMYSNNTGYPYSAQLVVEYTIPAPTGTEIAGGEWGGGEIG